MEPRRLGFRAKVRHALGRERSPGASSTSNTSLTAASTPQPDGTTPDPPNATGVQPHVIHARVEPGQRIFDTAVHALEPEDQDIISSLVLQQDVGDIKSVQDAVLAQKKRCEDEKWTMSVNGHDLGLSAVAGALSVLVGKVQPGIDVVSNVVSVVKPGVELAASIDPLHIGVPVALIKAVLGVVVFFSDQMERLLSGITTAAFMLKQLSLYFEYFKQVESPAEARNLENVLSSSYSLVFGFLATGHRALGKRGPKRAWELLWSKDKVNEFGSSCKTAGSQLEMVASLCHRDGTHKQLLKIKEQIDLVIDEINKLDLVKATVQDMSVKIDLQRLRSAGGAAYDTTENKRDGVLYDYCLHGTRQRLIEEITAWCKQSSQRVFWVRGMAGTGKSTLIRTVARQLEAEQLLAASFFFRQDIDDQKHGNLFAASVTVQLLTKHPVLRPYVAAALNADLTLPGGSMPNQFARLLREPMTKAGLNNLVLVIDALDECRPDHARIILGQLARLAREIDIRIIITSRPEPELLDMFATFKPDSTRLEDIKEEESEADIRLFLKTCFAVLVREDADQGAPQLMPGWPDPASMDELVQLTKPLFIYAATLFRYVKEDDEPDKCLRDILETNQSTTFKDMQQVYLPILQRIYRQSEARSIVRFKTIVGSIVLLQNPLSTLALSSLLDIKPGAVEKFLKSLRSVLRVPDDMTTPVRILHKSFKDFLIDTEHEFRIDASLTDLKVLECCLKLMDDNLRKDVCEVAAPGTRRADFHGVGSHITPELEYACLYWVSHVKKSLRDNDRVHQFLRRHLLHWLEALSWLDRLSSAIQQITRLRSLSESDQAVKLSAFLDDALRFLLTNRYVVDLAPLQLYHSALVFVPTNSIVRKTFQHYAVTSFTVLPEVVSEWSPEVLRLQHRSEVMSVAFSPDGELLASGSGEGVRMWEVSTGEERLGPGQRASHVTAVAFSPTDGKLLASASGKADGTLQLWNVSTGEEERLLNGHDDSIDALAFSPDGRLLASASENENFIELWDIAQGGTTQTFEFTKIADPAGVCAVAFSPDSKSLASASWDGVIRLWDVSTGKETQRLEGHARVQNDYVAICLDFHPNGKLVASSSELGPAVQLWDTATGKEMRHFGESWSGMKALAFSPDGTLLATSSMNSTVRLYNTTTGEVKQKFEGHNPWVNAVVFSPNGRLVASASSDETVRVWAAATDHKYNRQKLKGHDGWVRELVFSPDKTLLATTSTDHTARLWNVSTCQEWHIFEGHQGWADAVAFSPNNKLLASGSNDGMVRLWDIASGIVKWKMKGLTDNVGPLTFSPDGELLASGEYDKIRIWDVATGQEKAAFDNGDGVNAMAFSPNGGLLVKVSRSWTRSVTSPNATTGEVHVKYEYHATVHQIMRSADGSLLVSGVYDGYESYTTLSDVVVDSAAITAGAYLISYSGGPIQFHLIGSRQDASTVSKTELALKGEWLQHQGQDLLWLPLEYRWRSAAHENVFVAGQSSGAISWFKI